MAVKHVALLALLCAPWVAGCDTGYLDATTAIASVDATVATDATMPVDAIATTVDDAGAAAEADAGPVTSSLTVDLWAHYRFDEDGGTFIDDSSGQKRFGTLNAVDGSTWLLDGGKFGGALHFNWGDYITVDNFPDAPGSFSVSLWLRTATAPPFGMLPPPNVNHPYGSLLSTEVLYDGGWQVNLEQGDDGGGIATHFAYWNGADGGYVLGRCGCVVPTQWLHVVSVVDGSGSTRTLSFYVNGMLKESKSGVPPIEPGTNALYFGTWSGALQPPALDKRFIVADLDDVAIWGRALTFDEVQELELSPPPDP